LLPNYIKQERPIDKIDYRGERGRRGRRKEIEKEKEN